jgi:hypothetical protein
MVCTARNFETVDENNVEKWLQSDACEFGFQHMTNMDALNAVAKQKK